MATANPFDVLPSNLFNPFGTQGTTLQRHYMAILLRLYGLAEFNRFGLTREAAIGDIVDYLRSVNAENEVAAEMIERDDDAEGRSITGQLTEQDYASYLLRRLAETGWIEREQHADYTETITLPDYAFTLLEALRSIQEQKPREFTGQLYTAHQLVIANKNKDFSPALAITQTYENVRQVVRGLSELNHNIRRYIERATRGRSPAELLQLQFDDYAQTLGHAYHALKTSDHVSRYRRDIIARLRLWERNADWLTGTAAELAAQGRHTPAQAEQEIHGYIRFIIDQLEGLDPLIEEIDRRHAQYLRTSLRQIRYQLVSADGSFKDRLVSLARQLAALQADGAIELPAETPGLQWQPVREPDVHSFFTLPQRRAPFTTEVVVAPALTPGEFAELRSATLQDVMQALTPDKINRYVLSFFNGHRAIPVGDLPPELLADLQRLTTIIAYSHHPEVKYGIETMAGDPLEIGPYLVAPFQLERIA
jgi:Family of unknown function (DUF5716)